MMRLRRNAERPTKDRKGARKMAPVKTLSQGEATIPLQKSRGKGGKVSIRLVAKKQDKSSRFDCRLIQKCRNDGMADSEIQKWMQEI